MYTVEKYSIPGTINAVTVMITFKQLIRNPSIAVSVMISKTRPAMFAVHLN